MRCLATSEGSGPSSCGVRVGGPPSQSPAGGDVELKPQLAGKRRSPAQPSPPSTDGAIKGLDRVSTEDDATQGKETVLWGVFFLFLKQLAVYNSFK